MENLNAEGFTSALTAFKTAPNDSENKIRSITNTLEKIMVHNIETFDLESLAQLMMAFN